jgi:tRNA dimethylallyltransferase
LGNDTALTPISLILIVGPTAGGKSALAAELALRLGGEVVSADAMAVYRGMDLGTAKPDAATLARVPHHLISVIEPDDRCDVARWLALAETAIAGIAARGRVPVIAGGTPLYTKVLLEGLSAGPPRDAEVRARLTARYAEIGPAAFHAEVAARDPQYAAERHPNDRQRLVRALEVITLTGQPYSSFHTTDGVRRSDYRACQIGLTWPRETLYQRINARAAAIFANGLIDEVRGLAPRLSPEAQQAVGYKEVLAHVAGDYDRATALDLVQRHSRHLAKHQLTWYQRFTDITWLPGDAPDLNQRAEAVARAFLAT